MYERIVVPLDGSELAEQALAHAEGIARMIGCPVHLVRVSDVTHLARYGPYGLAIESAAFEQMLTEEERTCRYYLSRVERDLRGRGVSVTTEVRVGSVRRELNAATRPGDLIVMASHGRGGVARWFLGSVAEDMVRHATVPIMLVRSDTAIGAPTVSEAATHASGDSTHEGKIAPDAAVVRSRVLRLLDKDLYSPEEASYLLGIPKGAIFQAAFAKRLTAEIIGHNVISIRRDDLLLWLEGNDRSDSTVLLKGKEPAAVE